MDTKHWRRSRRRKMKFGYSRMGLRSDVLFLLCSSFSVRQDSFPKHLRKKPFSQLKWAPWKIETTGVKASNFELKRQKLRSKWQPTSEKHDFSLIIRLCDSNLNSSQDSRSKMKKTRWERISFVCHSREKGSQMRKQCFALMWYFLKGMFHFVKLFLIAKLILCQMVILHCFSLFSLLWCLKFGVWHWQLVGNLLSFEKMLRKHKKRMKKGKERPYLLQWTSLVTWLYDSINWGTWSTNLRIRYEDVSSLPQHDASPARSGHACFRTRCQWPSSWNGSRQCGVQTSLCNQWMNAFRTSCFIESLKYIKWREESYSFANQTEQ